jgi:hypothetical protein
MLATGGVHVQPLWHPKAHANSRSVDILKSFSPRMAGLNQQAIEDPCDIF